MNNIESACKPKQTGSTRLLNEFSLAAGFGSEMIALLGICSYVGFRLDKIFNTNPWLLVVGFSIGFVGLLYRAYWIVHALNRHERHGPASADQVKPTQKPGL